MIVRIPHTLTIYEESIDGLVKCEIITLTFYTAEHQETPPEERCIVTAEVS